MQRAKQIFFAGTRRVAKGELFADDDPFLEGREVLFEPVDVPAAPKKATESKPTPKPAAKKTE